MESSGGHMLLLTFNLTLTCNILFCSDNGFLMMPDRIYHMSFTSWEPITLLEFTWGLKIRYGT